MTLKIDGIKRRILTIELDKPGIQCCPFIASEEFKMEMIIATSYYYNIIMELKKNRICKALGFLAMTLV